jgi:hypothetical protein
MPTASATPKSALSNGTRAGLAAAASVLQALFLYAAVFTWAGAWALPNAAAFVFAVFGGACLAGAVWAGSGVHFSENTQERLERVRLEEAAQAPVFSFLPPSAPAEAKPEFKEYGSTEFLFSNSTSVPDGTELISAGFARKAAVRILWQEDGAANMAEISQFPIYIGRDAEVCGVAVNDLSVSRRHARVDFAGGRLSISDAGSSNGAYVDGLRVSGETAFEAGQTVKLGRVSFQFEILR